MREERAKRLCSSLMDYLQADVVTAKNRRSLHGVQFSASWKGHMQSVFVPDEDTWGKSQEELLELLKTKF